MIYFICYSWRILSSFKNNLYRSFTQFIILSLPELIESFPASKKKTDRKLIGKRPLPAPDVFSITHVPLTTRNVFVTCDTTQRTSFRNNNCGLKNFQSAVKANVFLIKWNWFWKPLSFDQKCGWQQLERSTTGWQTALSLSSPSTLALLAGKQRVWWTKSCGVTIQNGTSMRILSYNYQVLFSSVLQNEVWKF